MEEIIEKQNNIIPQYNEIKDQFNSALHIVDDIVLKNYISKLHDFEIVPIDEEIKSTNLAENVRLFKITEMVYEKDEYSTYKFASVFNSLSTTKCAIFVIIDSNGEKTDFYMGIRSLDSELATSSLKDTLKNAMIGQFPGIKTQEYLYEDMERLLDKKVNNISVVSCVANCKDVNNHENKSFIQGLEKLALAMQGERYTAVIVANGTTQQQLSDIRKGYETIYTQLAPFAKTQVSYNYNNSINLSKTNSHSTSKGFSYSENQSVTEGKTTTQGSSSSQSVSKENTTSKVVNGIAATVGVLGPIVGTVLGGPAGAILGSAVSHTVSSSMGIVGNAIHKSETDGKSTNESTSNNNSKTIGKSDTKSNTTTDSTSESKGVTKGNGQNLAFTLEDKSISNILLRLDTQLKRLQEFESLGMWECAAYFMSEKPYAAEIAASTYKSLMRGENSGVEVCAINSWRNYEKDEVNLLKDYVLNMMHPIFNYSTQMGVIQVTPCSLVSGNELAIHMGLPRKSVCGLPVIEHADFGKEVVTYDRRNDGASINLGKIFNMGSTSENSVKLDIDTLAMHTFITGSTGSGKSNTVYELIRQLDTSGKNYLIIEPAKGEYKNVFGLLPDVNVFGTNPFYTPLLKINPFKFSKGIHILEHIDRLVEIFNVCWPMYAAMPAVLKDALLQSYQVCGWDLVNSENIYSDDLFPTFQDLLSELVDVIRNSAYSEEVKSNYMGSLVTRVKSLTNGLNGQIFSAKEISNDILFDKKTIIDLSRVGSMETKSFIMGILIMRLSEYRMTSDYKMNQPLKHVTILEEAHNILKKTSTEQDIEGANVAGKSVEMISNAIAEMRTYGEGFIIVDQSPSAVDISAIRNTNTKIIMRLPDELDRRMAGKSAGLKDEQLDEMAKLPKGVAVVYQNDWVEPVLCNIQKFRGIEGRYEYLPKSREENVTNIFKTKILELLLKHRVKQPIDNDIDNVVELLDDADLSVKNKLALRKLLKTCKRTDDLSIWKEENFSELAYVVTGILDASLKTKSVIEQSNDYDELTTLLMKYVISETDNLPKEYALAASQCLMKNETLDNKDSKDIYAAWITHLRNKGFF